MASTTRHVCLVCTRGVFDHQHQVHCDVCENVQHRGCDTGITAYKFTKAKKLDIKLDFVCRSCSESRSFHNRQNGTLGHYRLSTAYNAGGGVQRIVRRLLALPLLPSEHIPTVFRVQKEKVTDNDQLAEVFRYVQDTWIDSSLWAPEDWSVYGQPVRTNNDCEGWHRRLNVRTHSRPPFYVLLQLLHKEASFVETQAKLVSSSKLTKNHRKNARQMQGKILLVWDRYSQGGMSADSLLKKLSKVYGQ